MPKTIRLNFQIEETILDAFTAYANERFSTKSKLLLEWLQDLKQVKLIKRDQHTKMAQYQLRAPTRLAEELTKMAQGLEISRSSLLRNVVKSNLLKLKKDPSEADLMLITKTYPQIIQFLELAQSKGSMSELDRLLLAARANLEIGPVEVKKVQSDLEKIKVIQSRKGQDKSALARIKMVEGEILGQTGQLQKAIDVLNEGKVIAYANGDYILLSDIYYITALGLHMAGSIDDAIYNYENALEYITVQSEPYRYARIHVHMAMMAMFQLDLKRAASYLAKAGRIINKAETPHYNTILKTVSAFLLFIDENYGGAIPKLIECLKEFKEMHSAFGMYLTLQTLAKANLMVGHLAESQVIFKQIESQEKLLNQPFSQSRSDFFQLLIQSSEGEMEGLDKMEAAIELRRSHFNVEMEEYILGAGLYLYGDKKRGLKVLKQLSKKGRQQLIRTNALKTIENKKLYPVSVI